MPEQSTSSTSQSLQGETVRSLSRSPHPYHRQHFELPHPSYRLGPFSPALHSPLRSGQNTDEEELALRQPDGISMRSTDSDSGTEADDEHFLRGLPAPRSRPHKGLRGADGIISGTPSPLLSPAVVDEESEKVVEFLRHASQPAQELALHKATEKFQRKRRTEIMRRVLEVMLLMGLGAIVISSDNGLTTYIWQKELTSQKLIIGSLIVLYPLRLIFRQRHSISLQKPPSITIPSSFDPAPILYPPALTMIVSSLISHSNHAASLPNIILSIAALPPHLIPSFADGQDILTLQWFISCIPLFVWNLHHDIPRFKSLLPAENLDQEILILLCPLHQALCATLHYLTTTSLLTAELQMLSIALVNVLLLSSSPQAVILKALLWGGGITIFISCGRVLSWGVALARVPKWRFRRAGNLSKHKQSLASSIGKITSWFPSLERLKEHSFSGDEALGNESEDRDMSLITPRTPSDMEVDPYRSGQGFISSDALSANGSASHDFAQISDIQRRNTFPNISLASRSRKRTPSGRKKRSVSSSVQSFFSLTNAQATTRKWLYAAHVYFCVLTIIFVGIRGYVGKYALNDMEPIGWALGYLFGNIQWFRMRVITMNLERWIRLPERHSPDMDTCHLGWVEHIRLSTFGSANTRLVICAYWLCIIIVGLAIVFRLSTIYEVDTRRKVFHFMMVAMLLPATYIDPCFAALALTLILAIFLLLDLFRASQLPPLSKPLAAFLTPYVDGRDLRGPVVISHIFLLIGCAIPLWLSLATLPRTISSDWELSSRDLSMVSGVICVGMGDAAASLIGRRYGRHKWLWVGGKSIEGSLAFALAVSVALLLAKGWLLFGGWQTESNDGWVNTLWKAGLAAGVAALTEAVLTGGNDNVVVPIVLWVCVKGLGM